MPKGLVHGFVKKIVLFLINFLILCFLGKTSQKKSFFDILDIKEWFLDQKSEVLKKSKNSNFPTVKILKRNYKEPTFNSCIYLMFALYLLIFLVFIIFIYSKRKNLKNNNTLGHFTLFINVSIKILKITKKLLNNARGGKETP